MNVHEVSPAGPWVLELESPPDSAAVFRAWRHLPHVLWLDSALAHPTLGRYSYLAADPYDYWEAPPEAHDLLPRLQREAAAGAAPHVPGRPPFQGGAGLLLSYDLGRQFERLPAPQRDEFGVPAIAVAWYDVVWACDHQTGRTALFSTGLPERDADRRRARARRRLQEFIGWLGASDAALPAAPRSAAPREDVASSDLAPQFPVGELEHLTSNFSRTSYLAAVVRAIEYIRAGDVFQVNLAQRLLHPATCPAAELYLRLRARNPAPFAGYFDLGEFQIVSASPERFVQVLDGEVETRPIKGTRQRSHRVEADLFAGDELLQSAKDRAENVMIVDLLRNDLSRVCQPASVQVTQLCQLETYAFVQHLVSAVRGRLGAGQGAVDAIAALFPGGSITGAPKIRAMEIIAELEPTARGPYCGCLGYLARSGALDLNILIRTITAGRGWWQLPVGGGIVADSRPEHEYAETWHKAEGLLRALV